MSHGSIYGELMYAWEYFDASSYAETVLEPSDLEACTIQDMRLLKYVHKLPRLWAINLELGENVVDLSSLGTLESLKRVAILGAGFESLADVLRDWPSVTEIKLASCDRLRDISALGIFSSRLQALEIIYCTELRDYGVLCQLSSLEILWLQGLEDLDLSCVATLSSLRDLTIADVEVADLRPLAEMEMDITVWDDMTLVDLSEVAFRPNLQILDGSDHVGE
jgi:hypothetical protein